VVIHEPVLEISCGQKQCAQTDRQTDRHTPMTTRPCGLRRAGKDEKGIKNRLYCRIIQKVLINCY